MPASQLASAPMARFGRRRRRRVWPAIVVVVLVLLAGAGVLVARDAKPSPESIRLAQASWLDLLRPFVEQSNQSAALLDTLRHKPGDVGLVGVQLDLSQLVTGTASVDKWVSRLSPPTSLARAGRLLDAAMAGRARAAANYKAGMNQVLTGGPHAQSVALLWAAGERLVVADQRYRAFQHAISRSLTRSARLPSSKWIKDTKDWSLDALGSYVDAVSGDSNLATNHDVSILTVSMDPPPVTIGNGVVTLASTHSLMLSPILQNKGNQIERDISLVATLRSTSSGAMQAVRSTANLYFGQHMAVSMPRLSLTPGSTYSLAITASVVPGEMSTGDNQQSFTVAVGS